jgi:hypothetical protein
LTFSGGWVYNSSGIVPNGTNTFANTDYVPVNNGLQDDFHLSYYSKTNSDGAEIEIGVQSELAFPVYTILEIKTAGVTYPIINTSGFGTFVDTDSRAFYLGNRISSNTMNAWRNNSKLLTHVEFSLEPAIDPIFIGAMNNFGTAAVGYTTKTCAYASIGKGFTDTQAVDYYNAITTFQTALSRQN